MRFLTAQYATFPMFDFRTKWLYALFICSVTAEFALLFALGLRLDSGPIIAAQSWPLLIVGAWASRRIAFDRLATGLEALALLYGQGFALCFSTAVLATISGDLADGWLSAGDRLLGFDWVSYYQASRPYLAWLKVAYSSFIWLPAIVIIGLTAQRQFTKVWQFVTAAMIALVLTICIFPLAPAASPVIVYQLQDPALGNAAKFWPIMAELRDGSVRTIDLGHLVGMVSFPSYHTVAAVQLAWAGWTNRWMRWPVATICIAMALAIPTIGDHYLTDMIAGALLAFASILVAQVLVRDPGPATSHVVD